MGLPGGNSGQNSLCMKIRPRTQFLTTRVFGDIIHNYTMQVQNARILVNATRDILGRNDRQEEEFDAAALLEHIH